MATGFDTMLFWGLALAMVAVALACVLPRLLGARAAPAAPSSLAANAAVHRLRLTELAAERAGGVLADADFERAQQDVERRLLDDVGDSAEGAVREAHKSGRLAIAIGMLLPLAALAFYAILGSPDAVQRPALATIAPAAGNAAAALGRDALVAHLARDPRDGRSWVLLARGDFAADRFRDAAEAYAKALDSPKVARDPAIWCEYADALGMLAGGTLAGKPRELIAHALALDPAHPAALEMAGSAAFEQGDYAAAAAYWRTLLARIPAGTSTRRELDAAIARAEEKAQAAGAQAPVGQRLARNR